MDCKDCPYKPRNETEFQAWTRGVVAELEVGHEDLWARIHWLTNLFKAQQEDTKKALKIIYDKRKVSVRGKVER